MHVKYIEDIINSQDNSKMEQLRKTLVETIDYLHETDPDKYYEVEDELYEIVEGKKLNKEKADEWVESMDPPAEWNFKEVEEIKEQYDISIPAISCYVTMNLIQSDFGDEIGDLNNEENLLKCIRMAEKFYYDKDAINSEEQKLYNYWKYIVN